MVFYNIAWIGAVSVTGLDGYFTSVYKTTASTDVVFYLMAWVGPAPVTGLDGRQVCV